VSLPGKSRVWTLGSEVKIPKRSMESFSSLESFVYGPYMWVLRYPAKIRAGKILNVSDDNMLKGNLAHQAFEDYFAAFPDIASADSVTAKTWISEHLRGLLLKQGAVLLRPGRAPERERFLSDVVQAIGILLEHLKQADVVSVEMETELSGGYVGGELTGRLDLLAHKNDGREAIIDIKWGGANYRQKALEQSKYLQLAIYSALHRQSGGGIPAVGYFIIAQGELLVLNDDYFPNAVIVAPENGEPLQEFWARFEQSWRQRRAQLDQGKIEVNVAGTSIVEDLLFDEKGLPSEQTYESFSEFGALVGWEADA
jgi:ATP-dependent helicase/nuclease subunit B